MRDCLVAFETPEGIARTINAYDVVRVIPRDAKTCVVVMARPLPSRIVLGSEAAIREKIANAMNAGIAADRAV